MSLLLFPKTGYYNVNIRGILGSNEAYQIYVDIKDHWIQKYFFP